MGQNISTVLIVGSNHNSIEVLERVLGEAGYKTSLAYGEEQGFKFIRLVNPDAVLLDMMLGDLDGRQFCQKMKEDNRMKKIPVILLASKEETGDMLQGFENDPVDFLREPVDSDELLARLKLHIQNKKAADEIKVLHEQISKISKELSTAELTIKKKNEQLEQLAFQLEQTAITDDLTGLLNRKHATKLIEEEVSRCQRKKSPFSLVIVDICSLRETNEIYGPDCGDAVLIMVSQMFQEMVRETDYVARWTGDELMVILPDTGLSGARVMEQRIRRKMESQAFLYGKDIIPVEITFGVAVYVGGEKKDELIKRADSAVYQGKRTGRNWVVG